MCGSASFKTVEGPGATGDVPENNNNQPTTIITTATTNQQQQTTSTTVFHWKKVASTIYIDKKNQLIINSQTMEV